MCVCVSYILPGITLPFEMKSHFKVQKKMFQFVKLFYIDISSVETKKKKKRALVFFPSYCYFLVWKFLSIVLCQTLLKTDQLICLLCNLHSCIAENMQNIVDNLPPLILEMKLDLCFCLPGEPLHSQ